MIVPDYVRSYELHLEHLIKHHGRDAAMELVVGGQYQQIGILESSALVTLGLLPDHTLVDVGCGSGRLAFHLKSYLRGKYVGTDILEESLRFAYEKCGRDDWEFIPNHLPTIPQADHTADFVTFFSVMTHLLDEDIFKFLREAKRVAKPGGRIVFSFLDYECEQHWPIFEQTVADSRPERVINKFIAKAAIRRWARVLLLTEERVYDGYEKWIELREPFTYADGRRAEGVVEFGQSVAVLRNVSPFVTTFNPQHVRTGSDTQGNDVYELIDEAGVKVQWSVPPGGKSTEVIGGTVRQIPIQGVLDLPAQQGARANAGICHAACNRTSDGIETMSANLHAARGAPAPVVAHP